MVARAFIQSCLGRTPHDLIHRQHLFYDELILPVLDLGIGTNLQSMPPSGGILLN